MLVLGGGGGGGYGGGGAGGEEGMGGGGVVRSLKPYFRHLNHSVTSEKLWQDSCSTKSHPLPQNYTPKSWQERFLTIIIIIHSFYIALFSALEQTYCAHWHVILNE